MTRELEVRGDRHPRPKEAPRNYLDWRIGGVLLGLLLTLAVGIAKPIGVSTAYCTTWGMALVELAPRWAAQSPYLKKVGTSINAEWMLVLGLALGSLGAALASRTRSREAIPQSWAERFGPSSRRRFAGAFAGGALVLFGARLAGGCTSGHVVSGMSQLAVSGFVFAAAVFASGILVARFVYGKDGAS
jgi:uncharacterized membrane protein YedE/YeeE